MKVVALCAGLVSVCAVACSVAAPPAAAPAIPKQALDELKSIVRKVKETDAEVVEHTTGEFLKTREVAHDVRTVAVASDDADKPLAVTVSWVSHKQESKIYSTREDAERAREWLPGGRASGVANVKPMPIRYEATLVYAGGRWQVDRIAWSADYTGVDVPKGYKPPLACSTRNGDTTPWESVFGGANAPKAAE